MASTFALRLIVYVYRDVARYVWECDHNQEDVAELRLYHTQIYFQSSLTAACSLITASNPECLRSKISPNNRSCRSWIACRRTSSSSARNMHTSACRDWTFCKICFNRSGRSSSESLRRK